MKRRVDRLVADGVIRGFTIQVDPAVDGLATEAYVELFCRGHRRPRGAEAHPLRRARGRRRRHRHRRADAIVHMRSRDIPRLEDALEQVRIAPNVDHTRSAIVLSKLITATPVETRHRLT